MRRQIKKQARVFAAIVVLFVVAMGIAGYILSNQRFFLPAWFPLVGTDFYEVQAELPTAQAVVPGQGQTVNIAGVKVGEVGEVKLEDGRAVVTMQIRDKYKPIYQDATILLRPKTGLKDMILALDPGTESAGEVSEGGRITVGNTLPDVNPDEVLASLDGDTRAYLQILLNAGGNAFRDDNLSAGQQTASADLRETFKRFEPTARDGEKFTKKLIERRKNIRRVIHNFQELSTALGAKDKQLAAFVDSSNKNFEAFAQEEGSLREALQLFPGTLSQTATTLQHTNSLAKELGPTLEGLRPFARELAPSLRRQRPFLRDTTPIIRDQIRPFARDVQPTVRDLRAATERPRTGHSRPHAQLQGAQQLLQHAGVRPARRRPVIPVLERLGSALRNRPSRACGTHTARCCAGSCSPRAPSSACSPRSSRATRSWACSPSSPTSPTTGRAARTT